MLNQEMIKLSKDVWEAGAPFVFASINSDYPLALEEILPQYSILTAPEPSWAPEVRDKGLEVIAPQVNATNTFDLLLSKEARGHIKKRRPSLLVFKSSFKLEKLASDLKARLLAPPSRLARRWENKLLLSRLLDPEEVPLIPQQKIKCNDAGYEKVAKEYGLPFVLQFAKGFGGNSTFLIHSRDEFFQSLGRRRGKSAKASQWIAAGLPLTLNGCILDRGVALSRPFWQVTGVPEFTPKPLASCGGDWDISPLLRRGKTRLFQVAENVGQALHQEGYRGFFGLDFLWVAPHHIYLVEINPRFTGSLHLFTKMQIARGEMPLVLLHMAQMLNLNPPVPNPTWLEGNGSPLTQLLLHSQREEPFPFQSSLKSGIYRQSDFTYLRPGHNYFQIQKGEFLLQLPSRNSTVTPGSELARIIYPQSLARGGQITSRARHLALWIRKNMGDQSPRTKLSA